MSKKIYFLLSLLVPFSFSRADDLIPKTEGFLSTVEHGSLKEVKGKISAGIPVDYKDQFKRTPLMIASAKGDQGKVKHLTKEGADVNAKCIKGWTPTSFAAMWGHSNVLRHLLKQDEVEVGSIDISGKNELMLAAEINSKSCIKQILDFISKKLQIYDIIEIVNHEDEDGKTAYSLTTNKSIQKQLEDFAEKYRFPLNSGRKHFAQSAPSRCIPCELAMAK